MIFIKELNYKFIDVCFELDSNTISLWNKKQWANEFNKPGIKVFGLSFSNEIIGICVHQVVLDESQINYLSVKEKFRRSGYGSSLICYLIEQCESLGIKRLLLEVSESNIIAQKFYNNFGFSTVGIRKNYYKNGSNAILKEKELS